MQTILAEISFVFVIIELTRYQFAQVLHQYVMELFTSGDI